MSKLSRKIFARGEGNVWLRVDTMTDSDSDSLVDDPDFLTPLRSDSFSKIRLTEGVAVYYRFESHFAFFYVVLSFESQGAYALKSLPILFYAHLSILDIWETIGDASEDDTD